MSKPKYEAWEREMEAFLAQAQALSMSGHRAAGDDAWKWAMGDTIAQMQVLVKRTQESVLQPGVAATVEAKETARKCRDQYEAFLPDVKQRRHQRGVLVDYAAIARLFPTGDPIRTRLSYSHARALGRVKDPESRADLSEQAIRLGWSVARLQAEINTAGQKSVKNTSNQESSGTAEKIGTQDETPREWAKTQNSTWFCAQTKNPITNRQAMVELHIQPESMLDAPLKRKPKRGGAAKKKPNGEEPEAPRVLRFENELTLITWLAARLDPADLKAAGLMPVPKVVESRISEITEKQASWVIVWSASRKPLTEDLLAGEVLMEEPTRDNSVGEENG